MIIVVHFLIYPYHTITCYLMGSFQGNRVLHILTIFLYTTWKSMIRFQNNNYYRARCVNMIRFQNNNYYGARCVNVQVFVLKPGTLHRVTCQSPYCVCGVPGYFTFIQDYFSRYYTTIPLDFSYYYCFLLLLPVLLFSSKHLLFSSC